MIELTYDFERGITYEQYAGVIGEGEVLSRKEVAERVGKHYSTVTYHLERAVSAGLINKAYGYTASGQPGWVYAKKRTMPKFAGADFNNNYENERNW